MVGGIIGICYKRVVVGEKLDGVDVGFVIGKCLYGFVGVDILKFSEGVVGIWDESVLVCWV